MYFFLINIVTTLVYSIEWCSSKAAQQWLHQGMFQWMNKNSVSYIPRDLWSKHLVRFSPLVTNLSINLFFMNRFPIKFEVTVKSFSVLPLSLILLLIVVDLRSVLHFAINFTWYWVFTYLYLSSATQFHRQSVDCLLCVYKNYFSIFNNMNLLLIFQCDNLVTWFFLYVIRWNKNLLTLWNQWKTFGANEQR